MENMEQETIKMEETRKQPSRLEVIGDVITVGVLGFWFGVGATLGTKMDHNKLNKNHKVKLRKHNKLQKNHNK